jgi:tetratricopeptide (TPR) repeat protein
MEDEQSLYDRGNELFDSGYYREAIEDFDLFLPIHPNDIAVLLHCASAATRLKRYEKALIYNDNLSHLSYLIKSNPNDANTWKKLACFLNELERYEDVLKSYDRALELDFCSFQRMDWLDRDDILYKLGRNDDALSYFDRFIELNPNDPNIWNKRGHLLSAIGRNEDALNSFDRALEINPDDADAVTWYGRALTLNKLNKHETAIEIESQYRDMADEDPNFDNLRDNPQFQALINSN